MATHTTNQMNQKEKYTKFETIPYHAMGCIYSCLAFIQNNNVNKSANIYFYRNAKVFVRYGWYLLDTVGILGIAVRLF